MPDPVSTQEMLEKSQQLLQHLNTWKENYIRTTGNPSEQVLFMTDKMIEKTQDDMQVISLAAQNNLTIPEAAYQFSKLPKHYGLENDRVTPEKAPVRQVIPQDPAPAEPAVREEVPDRGNGAEKDLNKAALEINKLEKALGKADPKWMWSSSGEYSKMKKSVKNLNKWLRENRHHFYKGVDTKSEEYRKASREYRQRLERTIGKVSAYLDKKQTDFDRDSRRRDDPGNQKWEQQRIRTALHGFDTLRTLQGSRRQSEASKQRDRKVEGYKLSLLSKESRLIFAREKNAGKVQENRQEGPVL